MNFLLDSNILIYAKINVAPEYEAVSAWLEDAVADPRNTINVCEVSLLSFLRIATNPKVFQPCLPVDEAHAFIDSLLACPNVNLVVTSRGHYAEVIGLMKTHELNGNLVMDAHLAALALGIGAVLVTRDRDFVKIPYLKLLNPLKSS